MSFQPSPGSSPGTSFGTLLMFLVGAVLVLPGICSLLFIVGTFADSMLQTMIAPLVALWALCFAISFGGILLIRTAHRRTKRLPGN
jgi:hypothetical protein